MPLLRPLLSLLSRSFRKKGGPQRPPFFHSCVDLGERSSTPIVITLRVMKSSQGRAVRWVAPDTRENGNERWFCRAGRSTAGCCGGGNCCRDWRERGVSAGERNKHGRGGRHRRGCRRARHRARRRRGGQQPVLLSQRLCLPAGVLLWAGAADLSELPVGVVLEPVLPALR